MKILVALHTLDIGGSPINAVDLAAGVRDQGHEVMVYGVPGPLVDYIEGKGLPFIAARPLRYRPAPSRIAQMAGIVRREGVDLVHTYEWPPCLDAYFGAHLVHGTRLVATVYSMDVPPYVPRTVPIIMGTRELRDDASSAGFEQAWLLEPPINTALDRPDADLPDYRASHGISPTDLLIVCASRLALQQKLGSLVEAMDAVDTLAGELPVRFFLLGDGDAAASLRARAEAINRRHGREVVTLPGTDPDPRAAYAAADVVLGMGMSALRGLAFARTVVVQGEDGFALPFAPETQAQFLEQGMWGIGDGTPATPRLVEQLDGLLRSPEQRAELGRFGRHFVLQHFALDRAIERLVVMYREAMELPVRRDPRECARVAGRALELEWQMHDPRRKRARAEEARARYDAAQRVTHSPT